MEDKSPLKSSNLLIPADAFFKKKYAIGLGCVYTKKGYHEYDFNKELIGYIKEGNTTGTVYSHSYLLGMENLYSKNTAIDIFPNPATDVVHIKGLKELDFIRITDIQGLVLFEEKVKVDGVTFLVPVESYTSGIYFISIINGNNIYNKKIVISN